MPKSVIGLRRTNPVTVALDAIEGGDGYQGSVEDGPSSGPEWKHVILINYKDWNIAFIIVHLLRSNSSWVC